jgi:hypothetical protein
MQDFPKVRGNSSINIGIPTSVITAMRLRRGKPMPNLLCQAKGNNGQLEVYDDKVVIKREGAWGFSVHRDKGDKEIIINQITAIEYKLPYDNNNSKYGYIQFAFRGGQEHQGRAIDAWFDENTIFFTHDQEGDFDKAKKIIDRRIAELSAVAQAAATSTHQVDIPDQIRKLDELRKAGILSEEEFAQKKAELLARL